MRAALLQLSSSDTPEENLAALVNMVDEAAGGGAAFVLTPEVSNCVSTDRAHQNDVLTKQDDDPILAGLRVKAATHGVWLSIGSLALKGGDGGRFVNRSFLIAPDGSIAAQYDKMHMFDVDVSETESYHESSGYAPGDRAVVADTPLGRVGLTVCYDIRFPYLYRTLAKAGAELLLVPSAFSPVTGVAHWEPLLRARAIETGSFVLAAAQTGTHKAISGKARQTFGHSMVVDPWGRVLLDAGAEPGVFLVDIQIEDVAEARRRIPSLSHDRDFTLVQ